MAIKGIYITYYGNLYKILGFNGFHEAVKVKLIKRSTVKLCSDDTHHQDLEEGKMWVSSFFEKATIAIEAGLLYEEK